MAESSDRSGDPTTNVTLDGSAEPVSSSDAPNSVDQPPMSQAPGSGAGVQQTEQGVRSLRSFKKSVERAISRATGELQAYSEALSTLVQERHIYSVEQTVGADDEQPGNGPGQVQAETAPAPPAEAPNEAASALARLVKQSKPGRKSKSINVQSDAVSRLIEDTIVESGKAAEQEQALRNAQASAQTNVAGLTPPQSPSRMQPAPLADAQFAPLDAQFAPPDAQLVSPDAQLVPPDAQLAPPSYMQTPSRAPEESRVREDSGPVVDLAASGSGFHSILSRAGRAVKRTTGEVHVYTDAVSKLISERAHGHHGAGASTAPEATTSGAAAADQSQPGPAHESGLQNFVGRAIRRTTGEMAALRSQLSQLVDEARIKENQKSQERLQSMQTTDRLPIEMPERLECYKYASLCPSVWADLSGGDQYRHCNQCGLFVYDFKDKSPAEVEKIVFQREGIAKPSFYRRADGRFLIRDCPVGLARRQKRVVAVAAIVFLVGGVFGLGLLMPKPPPPPPVTDAETKPGRTFKARTGGQPDKNIQQRTGGSPGAGPGTGYGTGEPSPSTQPPGSGSTGGPPAVGGPVPPGQAGFVLPEPPKVQVHQEPPAGTPTPTRPPEENAELEKSLHE